MKYLKLFEEINNTNIKLFEGKESISPTLHKWTKIVQEKLEEFGNTKKETIQIDVNDPLFPVSKILISVEKLFGFGGFFNSGISYLNSLKHNNLPEIYIKINVSNFKNYRIIYHELFHGYEWALYVKKFGLEKGNNYFNSYDLLSSITVILEEHYKGLATEVDWYKSFKKGLQLKTLFYYASSIERYNYLHNISLKNSDVSENLDLVIDKLRSFNAEEYERFLNGEEINEILKRKKFNLKKLEKLLRKIGEEMFRKMHSNIFKYKAKYSSKIRKPVKDFPLKLSDEDFDKLSWYDKYMFIKTGYREYPIGNDNFPFLTKHQKNISLSDSDFDKLSEEDKDNYINIIKILRSNFTNKPLEWYFFKYKKLPVGLSNISDELFNKLDSKTKENYIVGLLDYWGNTTRAFSNLTKNQKKWAKENI